MALKLKKENVVYISGLIKDYMKQGRSLDEFLSDFQFTKRKWEKLLKKSRKLQDALDDGLIYYKAYWQRRLGKAMFRKNANSSIAKMAFENALGWTEEAAKRQRIFNKPRMTYKVYLDLEPEPDYKEEQEKLFSDDIPVEEKEG